MVPICKQKHTYRGIIMLICRHGWVPLVMKMDDELCGGLYDERGFFSCFWCVKHKTKAYNADSDNRNRKLPNLARCCPCWLADETTVYFGHHQWEPNVKCSCRGAAVNRTASCQVSINYYDSLQQLKINLSRGCAN